jgi:hypothetical protein
VGGGWRRLHNEEHYNLHASPNIIQLIISRKMGWMGHEACMGDEKCMKNFSQKT